MPDAEGRYVAAIIGSRDFFPDDDVWKILDRLVARHPEGVKVIVRDHNGVDKVAWQTAALMHLPYEILPEELPDEEAPLGEKIGVASDLNGRLVAAADTLIAFFHPGPTSDLPLTSSGSVNAFRQAQGRKMAVYAFHEGKWYSDMPRAESLPPDGWVVPRGYRAGPTTSMCGSRNRRGCGNEVLWVETPRGRKMPLNRDGSSHLNTCSMASKPARYEEAPGP